MTAYYNEIDPYAAAWLENLIAAGLIPAGHVDRRSIVDVRGDDLRGYAQCHFFAGLGGWPCAFRIAGWPDTQPVWSGSCPCQPFSGANKHARGEADTRHLWPEFYRLVRDSVPPIIFGEQIASQGGLPWLSRVRLDLEMAGYAVGAANLPACGVGAPQKRERLWFVAVGVAEGVRRGQGIKSISRAEIGWPYRGQPTWADARALGCDGRTRRSITAAPVVGHGYPNRVARMRAIGNAIVPQVAAKFIAAASEAIEDSAVMHPSEVTHVHLGR